MKCIIAAAVIVIGGIWYLFWKMNAGIKSYETEVISARLSEKPAIADIREELSYSERDPFASPLEPSEEVEVIEESFIEVEKDTGIVLTGIILRGESPSAIVNRKIVRIGDIVEGKKVIVIRKDAVVLSDGKRKYVLYLRRK